MVVFICGLYVCSCACLCTRLLLVYVCALCVSICACVSVQKGYGEVSLMDCMRLFTKEDVLDGDEKPVSFCSSPVVITVNAVIWNSMCAQ